MIFAEAVEEALTINIHWSHNPKDYWNINAWLDDIDFLRSAAASGALQGVTDMVGVQEMVRVSTTVTSHEVLRPLCHGTTAEPSECFLSPLGRPVGSFVAGTWALFRARQTVLLWYEDERLVLLLQEVTVTPQWHGCKSQSLSLCADRQGLG